MFGLFRSDPDSERHRGLTMILVQLDGETGFAEVFLDDVRVPVTENTVSGEGKGWRVAMSTAGFERGLLLRSPGRFMATAQRLIDLFETTEDAPGELRDEVVRSWIDAEAYRLA